MSGNRLTAPQAQAIGTRHRWGLASTDFRSSRASAIFLMASNSPEGHRPIGCYPNACRKKKKINIESKNKSLVRKTSAFDYRSNGVPSKSKTKQQVNQSNKDIDIYIAQEFMFYVWVHQTQRGYFYDRKWEICPFRRKGYKSWGRADFPWK